eukprot:Lithocolla_globosa_v1_NODE_207_length_5169_cov_7.885329.p4 type:complete len:164 gc:universal NODE_207_length_5169_cov_7.885329:1014-1505(+)
MIRTKNMAIVVVSRRLGSQEATIIYNAQERGLGVTCTTILVNEYRGENEEKSVSWNVVEQFILKSDVIKKERRQTKKSGKDDEGTVWAQARLAQCLQWARRLALSPTKKLRKGDEETFICLHGLVFWDEHHRKIVLVEFQTRNSNSKGLLWGSNPSCRRRCAS